MNKPTKQSLENMSLSNLIGLYALAGIAIAGLVGYLLILPQIQSAQETGDKIATVEAEINGLNRLIEDTETLRNNYEAVREDRNQILSLLPHGGNEEEYLLTLLNQTASRNGVVMSSFQPQTSAGGATQQESAGAYRTYQAEITVSGRNQQLENFLQDLESSSRFIFVTELIASTQNSTNLENPNVNATMVLEAYYQTDTSTSRNTPGSNESQTNQGGQVNDG